MHSTQVHFMPFLHQNWGEKHPKRQKGWLWLGLIPIIQKLLKYKISSLVARELILASKKKKKTPFCESTFPKWDIAARIGRESRESQSGIGEKTRFARIWPSVSKISIVLRSDSRESIRANLRNVGVRIACPLRFPAFSVREFPKEAQSFGTSSPSSFRCLSPLQTQIELYISSRCL